MPPKKPKPKSSPVVVGTVSTRSTRRQSIVNIEIPAKSRYTPKAKKLCPTPIDKSPNEAKHNPATERSPRKEKEVSLPSPSTKTIRTQRLPKSLISSEKRVRGRLKKNPTILEILKDWSDDESSQNSSESAENVQSSSDSNAGDKQRLISILEGSPRGGHSPLKEIISTPKSVSLVENINVSPQTESTDVEESIIIEECVVDDNSCIILDEPDVVTEFVTDEMVQEEIIISSVDGPDLETKPCETEIVQDTEESVIMETNPLPPIDNIIENIESAISSTVSHEIKLKKQIDEQVTEIPQETPVDEFKSIVEEMEKTNIENLELRKKVKTADPLNAPSKVLNELVEMDIQEPSKGEVTSDLNISQEKMETQYNVKKEAVHTSDNMEPKKYYSTLSMVDDVKENKEQEIKDNVIKKEMVCTLSHGDSNEYNQTVQEKIDTGSSQISAENPEQVNDIETTVKNSIEESFAVQTDDLVENHSSQDNITQELNDKILEREETLSAQHVFEEEALCSQISESLQVTEPTLDKKTLLSDKKIEQDILELKVKELNLADNSVTSKQNQEMSGTDIVDEVTNNLKTSEVLEENVKNPELPVSVKDNIPTATATQESKDVRNYQIISTSGKLGQAVIAEDSSKARNPPFTPEVMSSDDILMDEINSDPNPVVKNVEFGCVQNENVLMKKQEALLLEDVEMTESPGSSKENIELSSNTFKMDEELVMPDETIETKDSKDLESTNKTKPGKAKSRKSTRWSLRVKDVPKEPENVVKTDAPSTPPVALVKDEKIAKVSENPARVPEKPAKVPEKPAKVPKAKTPKMKQPKKQQQTPADLKAESKSPKEGKPPKDVAVKELKTKKTTSTKKAKDPVEKKDKKPKTFEEALKEERRRSNRIKSITVHKKPEVINSLVKSKSDSALNESQLSDKSFGPSDGERSISVSPKISGKDKLSKSRTKSSENLTSVLEGSSNFTVPVVSNLPTGKMKPPQPDPEVTARLKQFVHLKENSYKTDRQTCKEAKKMVCDCFLSEEISRNSEDQVGCGDDCLNRLLLIECGNLCPLADRCTNKRFQKGLFAPLEVFNTDKKGLGLRAAANIPYGEFILEYVGEVLDPDEFDKRAENYSNVKNIHYYFMSLRSDAIIDATMKGNISRFINHSCDPNAETQKWTVNGELRIGFFSTRTILAGEEVTFDYRFQRYGKEAQKCFCEAATCRGWLGDSPEDEESEDEEDEEEVEEETVESIKDKAEKSILEAPELAIKSIEEQLEETIIAGTKKTDVVTVKPSIEVTVSPVKKKLVKKKPRKDIFEDLDQLEEEIDMLVTTGLKNQAHTLKLSRLMVRAKEPEQRKKLLRVLRRGELPCRRLFLDYHGLRLMHGYMIDAQHLACANKNFESLRLEMLQTLAVLPIPNKTMLQDSKVLPTVQKWATNKNLEDAVEDSDSNSPKNEPPVTPLVESKNQADLKQGAAKKNDVPDPAILDQEEEIKFLASKLVEEWSNLKEVFKIPKKERIEQMKEHEREANRKFMASSYAPEQETSRKNDQRYRTWSKYKSEKEFYSKKGPRPEDKDRPSAAFLKISKHERRKLFALQMEVREEERRMKQRELWRQHELNCMLLGMDPRFTAPFDPSKGYQCIWNPTMGQWQNYPLPPENQSGYGTPPSSQGISLPNMNIPPPQRSGLLGYRSSMGIQTSIMSQVQPQSPMLPGMSTASQMKLPGLPGTITSHPPIPTPLPLYQELKIEEDPSKVKFAGPIPPPVKLPPKWKCAKDKYGRPYYFHVKLRKSQWEPPPFPEEVECKFSSESSSSSDTSSLSSDSSSENSESDDELDDNQLLMEVKKQMERSSKLVELVKTNVKQEPVKLEKVEEPSPPMVKNESDEEDVSEEKAGVEKFGEDMDVDIQTETSLREPEEKKLSSIDIRLKEVFNLREDTPELESKPPKKKRRIGLCQEISISPRTEEDKQQFKEDLKRYKANKEKLKRHKELILQQTRKQLREISGGSSSGLSSEQKKAKEKRHRSSLKTRIKQMTDINSEHAKKIKETFRSCMATTVVGVLNSYRKPDCREAKITNTDDFKHLARKLTHFVMLKEIKHIENIEDLVCTDNVKAKAREYIKKYMSKFGEVYQKRHDEPDFKD